MLQLTSLATVKWQLRITHSAEDAQLQDLTERQELRLFIYLGIQDVAALYAEFGEAGQAALEQAVLVMVTVAYEDRKADGLTEDVKRLVRRFRTVGFSTDTN